MVVMFGIASNQFYRNNIPSIYPKQISYWRQSWKPTILCHRRVGVLLVAGAAGSAVKLKFVQLADQV